MKESFTVMSRGASLQFPVSFSRFIMLFSIAIMPCYKPCLKQHITEGIFSLQSNQQYLLGNQVTSTFKYSRP